MAGAVPTNGHKSIPNDFASRLYLLRRGYVKAPTGTPKVETTYTNDAGNRECPTSNRSTFDIAVRR
jgi:hypothetical protein